MSAKTPYAASRASLALENAALRPEALDHFIFLGVGPIRRVVTNYLRYDNGARPSQAIHGIPDPYPELREPPSMAGQLVALPVLGGVIHDHRLAA